jgi:hypothetical protein
VKPILLKLDDDLHAQWLEKAKIDGKTLSGWIRDKCNEDRTVRDTPAENSPTERSASVPVVGRRAARSGRTSDNGRTHALSVEPARMPLTNAVIPAGNVERLDEPAVARKACGICGLQFCRGHKSKKK